MAGIMSLLQKLGFAGNADDEMNTGKHYEAEAEEEEEDDEEEEEESRGGFGFPFSFSIFSKNKSQDDEEEEDDEDDEADENAATSSSRSYARSSRVIDYKKTKEKRFESQSDEQGAKHREHVVVVRQLSDSRTIITHLHNGDSVILNLENIDPKDCGRVIDLLSGAAFALGGNIIKVSRLTYLLAPDTVQVVPPQSAPAANRYSL